MARTGAVVLAVTLSALGAAIGTWFVLGATKLKLTPISTTRESSTGPNGNDNLGIPSGVRVDFEDVAESAGVHFRHFDGRVAKQYLMDTTGPGLAWLDYDGDGLFDLFLVQGSAIEGPPPSPPPPSTR